MVPRNSTQTAITGSRSQTKRAMTQAMIAKTIQMSVTVNLCSDSVHNALRRVSHI